MEGLEEGSGFFCSPKLPCYPIWEQCLNNFVADCSSAKVTFNPVLHEKDQTQAAIFCIAGSQTRYIFPSKFVERGW